MKLPFTSLLFFFLIFSCQPGKEEKTSEQKTENASEQKIENASEQIGEIKTPSGTCIYSRENTNEAGARIRVVQEEKFIAIQNNPKEAAKSNSKEITDFFRGYLSCVSVDSVLGVSFNFKFNTDDAYTHYGAVKKGNKIIFTLKSGKEVELYFGSPFSGNNNLSTLDTEYLSFAHLPESATIELKKEELARVRIFWSKRQEDYSVVNPAIFMNQLPCVE